jgi:4-amino-4-deoxy-L-arabinose transferase-like glycosyltransferase
VNEHLLRFLGRRRPADFHRDPIYTPLAGPFVLLFPWGVLLPAALRGRISSPRPRSDRTPERLFLLCWSAVPLVFFTLARTRTLYYLLPVAPPLALLIGKVWGDVTAYAGEKVIRPWILVPLALFFGAVAIEWLACGVRASSHSIDDEGFAFAFESTFCLVLGTAVATLLARKGRISSACGVLAVSAALTWVVATYTFGVWERLLAGPVLAEAIERSRPSPDTVVAVESRLEGHSAFVFYLPRRFRPVRMVEGRTGGDLEFGSRFPPARPLFISRDELRRLATHRELFYVTDVPPRLPFFPSFHLLRRQGDSLLWHSLPGSRRQ